MLFKSYDGKYGENLMGYIQFSTKVTGAYLKSLHPKIIWKKQSRSNFRCIEYIKNYMPEKVIKPLVEMGEHYPFKALPTVSPEAPKQIDQGDLQLEAVKTTDEIRITILK
jgi:hypothetical protein